MVQLGIDLSQITTRAQMADGVKLALEMIGKQIVSANALAQLRNGTSPNGVKTAEPPTANADHKL
jgi:hypothetical protein